MVVANARRAPAYIPRHAIRIPICPAFSCAMLVVRFFFSFVCGIPVPGFKYFDVVTSEAHHKIWIFLGRCCDICIESLTSSMQSSRSVFLFTKPYMQPDLQQAERTNYFFFRQSDSKHWYLSDPFVGLAAAKCVRCCSLARFAFFQIVIKSSQTRNHSAKHFKNEWRRQHEK